MKKHDQHTDDEVGGGGNMTFKTTSMSPKHGTSIRAVTWRPDTSDSESDNNGFHEWLSFRQGRERENLG